MLAAADRAIFVANVHKEIAGKQWSLMAHHHCSRVLEKLVQVSTPEQLNGLLSCVAGKYVKAMTTRHSSHVLQTLLAAVAHHLDRHAAAMEGAAGAQPLAAELAEALTGQVIAMADVRTRARHAEATAAAWPAHVVGRASPPNGCGFTARRRSCRRCRVWPRIPTAPTCCSRCCARCRAMPKQR